MIFSKAGLVLSLAPFVGAVHRVWRRRHPEVNFEGRHALAEQAQAGGELVAVVGAHPSPPPAPGVGAVSSCSRACRKAPRTTKSVAWARSIVCRVPMPPICALERRFSALSTP